MRPASRRALALFAWLVAGMVRPDSAMAHDITASPIHAELKGTYERSAGSVELEFVLYNSFLEKNVDPSALHENQGRKLRGFLLDTALKEFVSLEPRYENGTWKIAANLPRNGWYGLWLQGRRRGTTEDFAIPTKFKIVGGEPANPVLGPAAPDALFGTNEASQAELQLIRGFESFAIGQPVRLRFLFSRTDGRAPHLTALPAPDEGAPLHVTIVTGLGTKLVHSDPVEWTPPASPVSPVVIDVRVSDGLPAAGFYRVWLQFIDHGEARLIPFGFTVRDPADEPFYFRIWHRFESWFKAR